MSESERWGCKIEKWEHFLDWVSHNVEESKTGSEVKFFHRIVFQLPGLSWRILLVIELHWECKSSERELCVEVLLERRFSELLIWFSNVVKGADLLLVGVLAFVYI